MSENKKKKRSIMVGSEAAIVEVNFNGHGQGLSTGGVVKARRHNTKKERIGECGLSERR